MICSQGTTFYKKTLFADLDDIVFLAKQQQSLVRGINIWLKRNMCYLKIVIYSQRGIVVDLEMFIRLEQLENNELFFKIDMIQLKNNSIGQKKAGGGRETIFYD